ncbi:MAG: TrmH family RNA methyltransferase [Planctomycetota bacterium]|jgi:tRNA G18 (ribose-2'-O)-methylase SpoU
MERIQSIDDDRVARYRNLPERTLRGESIFVTEGRLVTRRLLESDYEAESVFVSERFAGEFQPLVSDAVPLYVGPDRLLMEVVGFKFHLGVLGAGRRRTTPSLDGLMSRPALADRVSLVVCPQVAKAENLGLIFRSAGAFGVDAIVLGSGCCDPLSRRCLRLSMGAVLQVPTVCAEDLLGALRVLKDRYAVELIATVVDDRAEHVADVRWPTRAGLLFGDEFGGLEEPWLTLCDRRITVPMRPPVDSLNLGVAAGICLYEWKARKPCR